MKRHWTIVALTVTGALLSQGALCGTVNNGGGGGGAGGNNDGSTISDGSGGNGGGGAGVSALRGVLWDTSIGLRLAPNFYVFAIDEQAEVLGWTITSADDAWWQITNLPSTGEVEIVGFHPDAKINMAEEVFSLDGSYQDVGNILTAVGAPLTGGFDFLLNIVISGFNSNRIDLANHLLAQIGVETGDDEEGGDDHDCVLTFDAYVRRVAGGTLNGTTIDQNHYEITVSPGERITGSIVVETKNSMGSGSVAPLGGTVDWGDRTTQPWETNGWISTGINTYTVSVDKIAPEAPGEYHIIIAFGGEFNMSQVMSLTNWGVGSVVWYDGNDLGFDWTDEQFETAIHDGVRCDRQLTANGMGEPASHPATAVVVHVR